MQANHRKVRVLIVIVWVAAILMASCSTPVQIETQAPVTAEANVIDVLVAETEFIVNVPEPLQNGQKMLLEIVDEVTGLALNPQRHEMRAHSQTQFSVKLPLPIDSVVKYRYIQDGKKRLIEYTGEGKQVRYRMVIVRNPMKVEDIISAWNNMPFTSSYGRIQGRIIQNETNLPIPGALVCAGGQQTLSASDGSFLLDSLPPGKHNIVIYSLDGSIPAYQQEAIVARESSTPAEIRVNPSRMVNITFLVTTPNDIPDGIPLRMVGNTYPLGNTFADLRGGVNTIASRSPVLSYQGNRLYRITVRLPAGLDLRYKYSLGDGFWNAERVGSGRLNTRQLIVPEVDTTINENLNSFASPGLGAITFNVTASAGFLNGETLSIQFNPYGWTEPIPMWPMGENRFVYILYSPLDKDILGEFGYRFCKNDQCGIADDATTIGTDVPGKLIKPSSEPQLVTYDIKQWAWRAESESATTVTSEAIPPRDDEFITGIELLPDYHPSWQAYIGPAFDQIRTIRSEWVILSPTWHLTSATPPVMSAVPGQDATWYDLSRMILLAREKGLKTVLHPTLSYYQPAELWWMEAQRDANWWQSWFDRYQTFVINYADLATQVGSEAIILGDPSLRPAFPRGLLMDGSDSGVPEDANERWIALIEKSRQRFSGKIYWRLDYPADISSIPDFINSVDGIYLVLSGKLGDFEDPQKELIRPAVEQIIGNDILLIRDRFDKPLIIGIAYPSAAGAANGCVKTSDACLPTFIFTQAGLDLPGVKQSLDEQVEIYNAIFEVVNQHEWIDGVVASGYYPAVAIEDKSINIRGKPTTDVVWFWFDRLQPAE
jgi:hypothetical protein